MLVFRRNLVAISTAGDIATITLFCSHSRLDLFGKVFTVVIVNQVTKGNVHTCGIAKILFAIVMVVNGNHSDTKERKNVFQVVAYFQIVTTKTGKVFDNHDMDFTGTDKINHPLKVRSLKVRATKAIVAELHLRQIRKVKVLFDMSLDQLTLCSNAVTFILRPVGSLVYIFQRKTEIDANALFHITQPPS